MADDVIPDPEPVELEPGDLEPLKALDRSNRLGRTAVQVGIPAAIVGIFSWLARLKGIDLDPGEGTDLPADVAGYFVAVIAYGISVVMNRPPKP